VANFREPAMPETTPVTADNFVLAESDLYFGNIVKSGGLGKFMHNRTPEPVDRQIVIRCNRDTLYSLAVFDLDAGPVSVTLPDSGKRFMSMEISSEDGYVYAIIYDAGRHTVSKEQVGNALCGDWIAHARQSR
jgi:hypothetical protein